MKEYPAFQGACREGCQGCAECQPITDALDGLVTEPIAAPPTRWGAHMQVQHRISGRTGEVQSVDFEEQIVTVLSLDTDGFPAAEAWRIENVYEQVQS